MPELGSLCPCSAGLHRSALPLSYIFGHVGSNEVIGDTGFSGQVLHCLEVEAPGAQAVVEKYGREQQESQGDGR